MEASGASSPDIAISSPERSPFPLNLPASSRSGSESPEASARSFSPNHPPTIDSSSSSSDQHPSSSEHASSFQSNGAENNVPAESFDCPNQVKELLAEIKQLGAGHFPTETLTKPLTNANFDEFLAALERNSELDEFFHSCGYSWTASRTAEGWGCFEITYMGASITHDTSAHYIAGDLVLGINKFLGEKDHAMATSTSRIVLNFLFVEGAVDTLLSDYESNVTPSSKHPDGSLVFPDRWRPTVLLEVLWSQPRKEFVRKAKECVVGTRGFIKCIIGVHIMSTLNEDGSITPGELWYRVIRYVRDEDGRKSWAPTQWVMFRDAHAQLVPGSLDLELRHLVPDDMDMNSDIRVVSLTHDALCKHVDRAERIHNASLDSNCPAEISAESFDDLPIEDTESESESLPEPASPAAEIRKGDSDFNFSGKRPAKNGIQTRAQKRKLETTS